MARRSSLLVGLLTVGVFLGAAPGAMAGGFGPAITVREGATSDNSLLITDLDGVNPEVGDPFTLIASEEDRGADPAVAIDFWNPSQSAAMSPVPGQAARVDRCAGGTGIVFARQVEAVRTVTVRTPTTGGLTIDDNGDAFTRPDIACSEPGRQAMTFLRKGDAGQRVWLFSFDAAWLTDDLNVGLDLGPASTGSTPSVAATPSAIHIAWKDGTKLRYKRFAVGDAPGYAVTPLPTQTLDTSAGIGELRLGAEGKRVVIAWERGSDVVARVSTDRGASWKPRATLFRGGGPAKADAAVTNADVLGKTVIVSGTVWTCFEGCGGTGSIKRSTTNGGSWATVKGSTKRGGYVLGALAGDRSAPSMFMAWDQRFNLVPVIKARYAP